MTEGNNEEVKEFVERVEVTPSEDDEIIEIEKKEKETPGESSEQKEPEGEESETEESEEDTEDEGTKPEKVVVSTPKGKETDEIKRIAGETPREYALRLENKRLRDKNRSIRTGELLGEPKITPVQREMSPEKKELLSKYKPDELAALREVIPVLAEEMGLVSEDQLHIKSVVEKSNEVFEHFMEEHPEYSEENDPDGTLWNAFKQEYGLFAKASDPKQLRKILERTHTAVFGIQPAGALKKVNAAQEKVKVASHGSNSKPQVQQTRKSNGERIASSGARIDMLKGFSEEEIAEMSGGEE